MGYVVSERVGRVIDAEERVYFGLFTGIDGFVSARPEPPADSTFRIVIERAGQTDTTVSVDPEVAAVLGRYLDEFEFVHRDAGKVDWRYLIQVARVRPPFDPGMELEITRTDGSVVKGRLMHIDEAGLLVTSAKKVPAMLRNSHDAVWIPAGTLREVRDQRSVVMRLIAAVRLLEAGSQMMYRPHVVPLLERGKMLKDALSPELRAVRARGAVTPPYHVEESVDQIYQTRMASRVHVTAVIQPMPSAVRVAEYGKPTSTSSDGTMATIYFRHPMQFARIAYGMRVDYDLSNRLSVGVEYGRQPTSAGRPVKVGEWSSGEALHMLGSFVTGWATVSLRRARFHSYAYSVSPNRLDMLALSGDVGISVGWLRSQYPEWFAREGVVSQNYVRVGPSVAVNAESYLTHRLSVVAGLRVSVYPNLQFPLVELTYRREDSSDYTWTLSSYNEALWLMDFRACGCTSTLECTTVQDHLPGHSRCERTSPAK